MSSAFSFDPGAHEYSVGTRVVPACTWMLATGGLVPFARVNADVLERRSELGAKCISPATSTTSASSAATTNE